MDGSTWVLELDDVSIFNRKNCRHQNSFSKLPNSCVYNVEMIGCAVTHTGMNPDTWLEPGLKNR